MVSMCDYFPGQKSPSKSFFVKTTYFLKFDSDTKKDTTKETARLLISTDVRISTKISAKDSRKEKVSREGRTLSADQEIVNCS